MSSSRVVVRDLGTFNEPDLSLFKIKLASLVGSGKTYDGLDARWISDYHSNKFSIQDSGTQDEASDNVDDIHTDELIYLYDSPDYCDPLPKINHTGTKNRACAVQNNLNASTQDIQGTSFRNNSFPHELPTLGFCEVLCCKRGYRSKLIMELATCNCRFRPCCQVECDNCPHQRLLHYCL